MHPVLIAILQAGGLLKGKAYFDGNGDYLLLSDNNDWNVGSGDFVIRCGIKRARASVNEIICAQCDASNTSSTRQFYMQFISATNKLEVDVYSTTNVEKQIVSTNAIADTDLHEIILTRSGNTLSLTFDGVPNGSVDLTGITLRDVSQPFKIGCAGTTSNQYFNNCYLDSFSFEKAGVKVLDLKFEEPVGTTTFIDQTGKTVTTNGNVVIVE